MHCQRGLSPVLHRGGALTPSWNSEAGRVSGRIVRVHTKEFQREGYTLHASKDDPRYEIKSDKTDDVAFQCK